ncbi:MAG: BTAD domain-containing putative transcriptional regulator, partial [Anaerolineae bacterium]
MQELTDALSLYRGELLPGFYDEWTTLERERLRAAFDHKNKLLLDRLIAEQRWDDVLHWGASWISLGRVPEPTYRALMIAHAGVGDLTSVSAVFHRFAKALGQELGIKPSEEMRTLHAQLARGEEPAAVLGLPGLAGREITAQPPVPGTPPFKGLQYFDVADADLFFGRESLTARLVGHLRERHSLTVVVGASGSGKSSVVRAGLIP